MLYTIDRLCSVNSLLFYQYNAFIERRYTNVDFQIFNRCNVDKIKETCLVIDYKIIYIIFDII